MKFEYIWPFLLPGILVQLYMQIVYIARGLKENKLKPFKRIIYILSIAIFGLAAIAVKLLRTEKTSPRNTTKAEEERVDHLTIRGIFFLLLIAYVVMGQHMLTENIGTPTYTVLLWLITISLIIMILYNLIPDKYRIIAKPILPIMQIVLCIPIQYLDVSGDNLFLTIIAGFSAINHTSLSQAKAYGIGSLGAYLLGNTAKTIFLSESAELGDLVRYFFVNALVVLLALLAFYTLKKQMITSKKLELALQTVKMQSEKLKELAIVEERNRIAGEMHDTVGHTLTAAVLTLEAAEGLVTNQEAIQKLQQGKEQVRRGLSELRASVKVVRAANEENIEAVLLQLVEDMSSDTGLDINLVIESKINMTPLQAGIILSAIKECTTNSIKHGQATHVDILIGEYKEELRLTITDNGKGTNNIKIGSGLSIMKERVQSIGGIIKTESTPGEGFTVSIIIPVMERKEDV